MEKNNKTIWISAVLLVVAFMGFFVWAKAKKGSAPLAADAGATVPLLLPDAPLLQHIHPVIKIFVDGKPEVIPGEIGLTDGERAVHTHDDTGTIHVEAQDARQYTLGDFFSVWGKTIERPGYAVAMTVDGGASTEFGNLMLKDAQQIVLNYTKTK